MQHLRTGQEVTIIFDPGDAAITPEMVKYNKTTTVISRIHKPANTHGSQYGLQYELEGCVSSSGVPFIFTKDMLFLEEEQC